ncbi:MAG TPA: hypothetical protein PK073_06285 [Ignavibacteriaceae bacterium]|jgi:hypothetical protein|nr:MAG: hypothetical protein BWY38_01425 [Ignavibacteria bacterium ADurb.Bin266]OQY72992.1 MAG: hypothetical protein B6D44_08745 [Ignavibacteriales bacterium UTCHB2]HQF42504.1 hypothetical protein [Ignavibacteriaceae bacterium]HQI40354.1 hypothetical protein [Ignavibacteriaceae bacterium]HQJ46960.1 hypothetical protein [Ignavibacteriaceae bacterium]
MFNKSFITFLILSMLNFLGCYSSEVISRKDLNEGLARIDFDSEINITTVDYNNYNFLPGHYQIENDTLSGEGRTIKLGKSNTYTGKIAMNDILSFEQDKLDVGGTIGLVLGVAAVGFVTAALIVSASISDAFNHD